RAARFPDRAGGLEAAAHVVNGGYLEPLRLERAEKVFRHPRRGMLLEDADIAEAHDVVLEALELDAAVGWRIGQAEQGIVGEPAVGADGAELARFRDDFLLGPRILERLERGRVDGFGADEREGPSFCDGHAIGSGE